jgi:hypothetical protein
MSSVREAYEKAVDGAKGEITVLRTRARSRDMVEQPGDLRRAEVRIDDEPRFLAHPRYRVRIFLETVANVGRAAALPHDREIDRPSRRAIPHDRGFTLVRDTDGGDVLWVGPRPFDGFFDALFDAVPDLATIVRHPSGLRKVLGKLDRGASKGPAGGGLGPSSGSDFDDERRGSCGPLVDREQVLGHEARVRRGGPVVKARVTGQARCRTMGLTYG